MYRKLYFHKPDKNNQNSKWRQIYSILSLCCISISTIFNVSKKILSVTCSFLTYLFQYEQGKKSQIWYESITCITFLFRWFLSGFFYSQNAVKINRTCIIDAKFLQIITTFKEQYIGFLFSIIPPLSLSPYNYIFTSLAFFFHSPLLHSPFISLSLFRSVRVW